MQGLGIGDGLGQRRRIRLGEDALDPRAEARRDRRNQRAQRQQQRAEFRQQSAGASRGGGIGGGIGGSQPPTGAQPGSAPARGRRLSIGGLARGVSRGAFPAVATFNTFRTPTEQFSERFGLTPRNDGTITGDLLPNAGIRTLGFASELGNALTFGIAGNLFRDRQNAIPPPPERPEADPRTPPGVPGPQPAGAPVAGPQAGAGTQPQRPATPGRPSQPGAIVRNGNNFSNVGGIEGGVPFQQTRGGFVSSNLAPGEPTTLDRLRQQQTQQQAERRQEAASLNQTRERRSQREGARAVQAQNQRERDEVRRLLARNARGGPGISARMQRQAQELLAGLSGNQPVPQVSPSPSPADVQALDIANLDAGQQQANAQQQAIQQRLATEQAAREAQIQRNLANIGELPPEQQRTVIDQVLALQGRTRDSGNSSQPFRLQTLTGGPTEGDRAIRFNQQTGEFDFIEPAGSIAAGVGPGARFREGAVVRSNGRLFRIVNGIPTPLS